MQSERAVVLATGLRVQRFLDVNVPALAAVNATGARKTLDDAVGALSTQANVQETKKQHGKGATTKQRALRRALEKQMRAIDHIGRASLSGIPEFSSLRMPAPRVTTQGLLEHASAMSQAADAHAQVFTDAGLPADFLTQLQADADAIAASRGDRNEAGTTYVAATNATLQESTRIRHAVKVLDALVKLQLADTDPLLAGWTSAKRFHVLPVATSPATPPATSSAQPTTPPAASTLAIPAQEVTKPVA